MWENRPVMLLSWVAGRPLADQLQAHPASGWVLGRAYGRMQAAIHQIAAPADADSSQWIEWAGDEPELKARLYDLTSRRARLLHLDYHPLNVMANGRQISGVLDWANAQFGDPRADIARTYTILRVEPYSPGPDSLRLALFRQLLARAWDSGYTQAAGRLEDMALFYAWAGAVMIRDLSVRIGQPGHWLESQHLDPVRRWRDGWKRRAGLRP
jgi:Ser/Thr protein kinase RdoA (MazF antagonist)